MTILLVEDNPGDQRLFEEALKEKSIDCRLIVAAGANESIDLIFTQKPDLIVMDINMAGLSGTDFVLLLQKNAATQFLPVVFLTGVKDTMSDSPDEIIVGDQTYPLLIKPADSQELKKVISKIYKSETLPPY